MTTKEEYNGRWQYWNGFKRSLTDLRLDIKIDLDILKGMATDPTKDEVYRKIAESKVQIAQTYYNRVGNMIRTAEFNMAEIEEHLKAFKEEEE